MSDLKKLLPGLVKQRLAEEISHDGGAVPLGVIATCQHMLRDVIAALLPVFEPQFAPYEPARKNLLRY